MASALSLCRAGALLPGLRLSKTTQHCSESRSPARRHSHVARCAMGETRQSWLPGSTLPTYLDGSLPGDNGFDPLALAEDPEALRWYVHAELIHSRYAMMGVAGMLATDILRVSGVSPSTPVWFEAGAQSYSIDTPTLLAIQFFLYAFVESKRWADFKTPGSQGDFNDAFFFFIEPAFKGVANGYPGGPIFDPMGMGQDFTSEKVMLLREKELANGRLAMVAAVGFFIQAAATGKGPVENLLTHLADPWHTTVITNYL